MGLSQRRRTKKSIRSHPITVSTTQEDASNSITADFCRRRLDKRTGNTLRRVCSDSKRELNRTNLLAFQVTRKRDQSDVLMPSKPAENSQIGVQSNANLYNSNMIRMMDNDFTSFVPYSLNKRGRWQFTQELRAEYENCENLKDQNFYMTESVIHQPGKNCAVKTLTTNTLYMYDANAELRDHQRRLRDHEKRHLVQVDQFKFSDAVTSDKMERPLTQIAATTGQLNVNSILEKRQHDQWKKPVKLSPSAELAQRDLKDDFKNRIEISVGTCRPGLDAGSTRYRMADKGHSLEQCIDKPRKSFPYQNPRTFDRMVRRDRRCQLELQLDMDETCPEDLLDTDVVEEDEDGARLAHRCVTINEAMYEVNAVHGTNRAKKLVLKDLKMKRRADAAKRKKLECETVPGRRASSGYASNSELNDEAHQTMDAADKRLSLALQVELAVERPLMKILREDAAAAAFIKLFEGADQSLVIGNSTPRKVAVLLRSDLSESVVFEEAAGHPQSSADVAWFAVHYTCSNRVNYFQPKTSAEKVASQANPFEYLRGLIEVPVFSAPGALEDAFTSRIPGWKRAVAVTESDARLTAIRDLPMFSVGAADASVVLVPSTECEICCHELSLSLETESQEFLSLTRGSTKLHECGHSFCNICWLHHVASSVAQGRVTVTCPGFKCRTVLDAATVLWFCPADMLSALSSSAYHAWISARPDGRLRRLCSQAKCGRVLESRAGFNAVCGACCRPQCLACGLEPHWPVDCATVIKYHQKMKQLGHIKLDLNDLLATTEVNAKQCPTCRAVIEKGYGCNHMTCSCGQHFCWWCGGRMEDHKNEFPCYSQSAERRAASAYFVEQVFSASDALLMPNSVQSRLYCSAVRVRLHRAQIERHLSVHRDQIAELFATNLFRFGLGDSSFKNLWLEANRQSRRMFETVTIAVYLLEFTYAQADYRRENRQSGKLVRAVGSLVWYLIDSIMTEIREYSNRGHPGPKRSRIIYERLQMLLSSLQSRCGLLWSLTVKQGDATKSNGRK